MVNGLRIEMLGGLTVTSGGRLLGRFRTRKTASVLGYLAFHLGRTISRDVLIENFWPDDPERQAKDSLNTALSSLRRQFLQFGLEQALFADRNSVRLEAEWVSTDVAEFRALAAAGDLRALELYKGDLLEGFYEAWVIPAAAELAELKEGLSSRGTQQALPPDNLPRIDNAFVGREREMEQLSELCERNSLVTITGAAGVGKTRLALEFGKRGEHVWVVFFADAAPAVDLAEEILRQLGLSRSPGARALDVLTAQLAGVRSILILDNMEHLEGLDRSLPELLNALRSTVFVLTSRARLALSVEAVLVLDPLGVPESGDLESVEASPSVALFRARTKDRAPALGDLALVGKLCQRLEGISLAIEIAAARAEIYSVREMIEQLERPLEFLVTRDKDRPERHRSLRNAISWSYEQLTPATQRIFCLMAMAKAGWTLEFASGVLAEGVVEAMEELLHASLLRRTVKGEFNWFSMHQTVQGFGRELLGAEEQEAARAAMLAWFLKRFEIDNPSALGPKLKEWLDAAEVQIENVRDLLEWGFGSGRVVEAAQLCVYLSAFWYRRGHRYEAYQWMTRAMGFSLPDGLRADLLRFGGIFAKSQGEFVEAKGWLEEAERIYSAQENHVQRAAVLNVLGGTLERLREMDDAELRFNQAFEESQRVKDPRMGLPLMNLAIMAARAAQHRKAIEIYGRALEVGVEYNEPFLSGYVLANLAFAYVRSGAFEDAERVIEEALKTNEELGNRTIHGFALQGSGMLAYYRGDFAGAISELDKSKAAFLEGGELEGQAQSDILKARIALVEGRVREAKGLLGSARITASHFLEKRMEGEACLLLGLAGSDASWLRGAMDLLLFEPGSVEFHQLLLVMAEMAAEDAGALRAAAYDFYEASGTAADPLMRSLLEKPRGVGPDDPVAFAEAVLSSL